MEVGRKDFTIIYDLQSPDFGLRSKKKSIETKVTAIDYGFNQ